MLKQYTEHELEEICEKYMNWMKEAIEEKDYGAISYYSEKLGKWAKMLNHLINHGYYDEEEDYYEEED